jgi:hypothetical protein
MNYYIQPHALLKQLIKSLKQIIKLNTTLWLVRILLLPWRELPLHIYNNKILLGHALKLSPKILTELLQLLQIHILSLANLLLRHHPEFNVLHQVQIILKLHNIFHPIYGLFTLMMEHQIQGSTIVITKELCHIHAFLTITWHLYLRPIHFQHQVSWPHNRDQFTAIL